VKQYGLQVNGTAAAAHHEPSEHGEPEWQAAWLAELERRELGDSAEPAADEERPLVRARTLNAVTGAGR
jgi:hypothetical protein